MDEHEKSKRQLNNPWMQSVGYHWEWFVDKVHFNVTVKEWEYWEQKWWTDTFHKEVNQKTD